uniref:Uncharacterized protein n=1 Tax=Fagus sylvatica TaxID=28930 RepID=A0A2N9HB62_FAGSY
MQASVLPEHVLRLPRSNPPPLSSFSRGGYDRRDCVICGGFHGGLRGGSGFRGGLGFAVGFAAVTSGSGLSSLSQPPRSGLSSLSTAPDPVSTGEEKAVGPCCYAVEDLSEKKSINR